MVRGLLPWRQLRGYWWLMVRASGIGTIVGAIPGTGGPIASFLAYDHARRFSRRPDDYGKGELGGVVAPEAANNAVMGGALIPMLSLGIPGDAATAMILGGLLVHGLQPGPMLFQDSLDVVYALYVTIVVSWVVILLVQLWGVRLFVRVLRVPPHLLATCILVLCGDRARTRITELDLRRLSDGGRRACSAMPCSGCASRSRLSCSGSCWARRSSSSTARR